MEKKIITILFFLTVFIVCSKNFAFASGSCQCKTNNNKICVIDDSFPNTCPEKFSCNQGTDGCVEGNSCECLQSPQQPGEDNIPTVTIPGYPTETGILSDKNLTLGTVIGKALTYVYVIAGLALLLVLIMGGFSLMTAAGDPKKIEAGYGKIKDALIGFLVVFVSYFVVQIVEVVLGVKIL